MAMLDLRDKSITLIGVDCIHAEQLITAMNYCESLCTFSDVKILTSQSLTDSRIQRIPPIGSTHEYSFFIMKELAQYVETEFALVVQYDGYIQNPDAWSDEFLSYDYIGAPWFYDDEYNVGNGGFSLRSKKLLDILHTDHTCDQTMPEDHHVGRTYRPYLESRGVVFAPELVASQFSIEGNQKYGYAWKGQFGFHDFKSTLGVSVPYQVQPFRLYDALCYIAQYNKTQMPNDFVTFDICKPVCNDAIAAAGDLFVSFLNHYIFTPLSSLTIDEPVHFSIRIVADEESNDSLWVVVVQDTPLKSGNMIRPKWERITREFKNESIILEREIPRTQHSFLVNT